MTLTPLSYEELAQENQALRERVAELEHLLAERTASERRSHEILDRLAAGVLLVDADGRCTFANQRAASMFNRAPADLVGQSLFDVLPPEVAEAHLEQNRRLIAGQGREEYEATLTLPTGRRTFLITEQALADPAGQGELLLSTSVDITERVDAEQALRESEQTLRALIEQLPVGISVLDHAGQLTFVNPALEQILDLQHEALLSGAYQQRRYLRADGTPLPLEEYASRLALTERRPIAQMEIGVVTEAERVIWTTVSAMPVSFGAWRVILVTTDITARKQAEAALRESQQNLAALLENIDGRIWSVDRACRLIVGNTQFHQDAAAIIGREPLPGECLSALPLLEDWQVTWRAWYDRALAGETFSVEAHAADLIVEYRFHPIRTAAGEITGVTVFGRDITAQRQTEVTIRRLAERLDLATRAARIGVWDWDIQHNKLVWDDRMYELYGVRREDFAGAYEAWLQGLHPDDREASDASSAAARRGERPYEAEFRVVWPDGSLHVLKAVGDVYWDAGGTPLRMIGVNYDITELKRAEEALRASEARYRLLSEHSADVIWTLDVATFRFTYVSPSVERLRGYTPDEVLAQPAEAALTPESYQLITTQLGPRIAAFLAGDETARSETTDVEQPRKDGSIVPTEVVTTLLTDEHGQLTTILGVSRDITARRRAEEALRQLNETLERRVAARTAELARVNDELVRASRLKDEFLATMSHELRTPLSIILSRLELLQEAFEGPLTARQLASLRRIEASARHLLALIEDILNLSALETGRFQLMRTAVDVPLICQRSRQQVSADATEKRLTLRATLDPRVTSVWADERLLTQILVNLLSNAVKFTPEGGAVGLEMRGDLEQQTVTFTVWDTGIGIAAEDLPRLFQPFVQLDAGLNRQYEGTGLGLALVRRLVEAHQGSIRVESTPDQGSRFSVTLPWAPGGPHAYQR